MTTWQLQKAKAKLTEFVNQAKKEPQIISRHGKPEVVALSITKYNMLISSNYDIVSFFRKSPLMGSKIEIERDKSMMRDLEL